MRSSHFVQSSQKFPSHLLRRGGAFGLITICSAAVLTAQAQGPESPIQMAPPTGLPGVPAPAAPGANPAAFQGPALISLRFENAFVAEIVRLIAEQGNVDIIINDDVSDVRIKYLNLSDKTPEEAIKQVAETANLVWRKTDRNTYIIAKVLPELPRTEASITPIPQVPAFNPQTDNSTRILAQPNLSGFPELLPAADGSEDNAEREYQYVKIRNVTPRMMLYWIDPENNPEPTEFAISRKNLESYGQQYFARSAVDPGEYAALQGNAVIGGNSNFNNPYSPAGERSDDGWSANALGQFAQPYAESNAQFGGGNRGGNQRGGRNGRNQRGGRNGRNQRGGAGGGGGGGVFDLPTGVESVVAVDPQNALLVYATPRGFEQLQSIINFLDQPLKQVEIEAQFVDVSTSDVRNLGIDFRSSNGPFNASSTGTIQQPTGGGSLSLGFVRGNFQANLNTLISQNRAKIVNAPRVTAINNLTASLSSDRFTPITLNTTTTGIGGQVATAQQFFYIQSTIGLRVTPTINNDDTITVVMEPQVSITSQTPGSSIPAINRQILSTVANVKDGDTIALGGLRTKTIDHRGTRIPILSNIPILGNLFKSRNDNETEGELIIFLTARILRRVEDSQAVPGT